MKKERPLKLKDFQISIGLFIGAFIVLILPPYTLFGISYFLLTGSVSISIITISILIQACNTKSFKNLKQLFCRCDFIISYDPKTNDRCTMCKKCQKRAVTY